MIKYNKRIIRILENLKDEEIKKKVLLKKGAFSRKQKMNFEEMVRFMLKDTKKSLSNELIDHFKDMGKIEKTISKQAFSEQRQNISYTIFEELNKKFVDDYYEKEEYKTFEGYLVIADDGSTLELPNTPNIKEKFGSAKASDTSASNARGSVNGFYDTLNKIMLLSKLDKYQSGEKNFLMENLKKLKEMVNDKKILLIFDRGYICTELLIFLKENNVKYLFRCPQNVFKKELKSANSKDEIIKIQVTKSRSNNFKVLDKKQYVDKVIEERLLKIELDTGELEYLITNLTEKEVKYEQMSELYYKRWEIEKSFDVLKNKLQVENIGARTENGIKQEFYASILLYNFMEDIRNQMDKDVENNKGNKYKYKVNMNILVGVLKNNLIQMLYAKDDLEEQIEQLYLQISRNLVPIKPDRKNPRIKRVSRNKYKPNIRRSF